MKREKDTVVTKKVGPGGIPVWVCVLLLFGMLAFATVFASITLWVLYPLIEDGGFP